jgi:ubiquinone/menaquinone biosynthesis C-methylase UbiE
MFSRKNFKRKKKTSPSNLDNKNWWESNPMNYQWNEIGNWDSAMPAFEGLSNTYFENLDKTFFETSALFISNDQIPFDGMINFSNLKNSKVLEIGCGMGTHAELFCKHVENVEYTGIDLTRTATEFTKARLKINNLKGVIQQADAEDLPFDNNCFDYIWSWGVIHHSSNTEKIISEIHRVLKPGGKCHIMIYHKNSLRYYLYGGFYKGVLCLKLLYKSLLEINMEFTDGFFARHFTKNELFGILKKNNFNITRLNILPETDHLPFPGGTRLKKLNFKLVNFFVNFLCKKFGWFLTAEFQKKL